MSTQPVTQPPTAAPVIGASPPNGAIPVAPVATPIQPPVTQAPVAAVVPAVATPVVAAPVVAAPVVAASGPVAATPVAPAPATVVAPVAAAPPAAPVAATPIAAAAPQAPATTPVAAAPVAPAPAPVAATPAPAVASASVAAAAPPPVPTASAPAAQKPAAAKAPPKVILAPRLGKQKTDWKTLSTVVTISLLMHALALAACGLIVFNNPKILEEIFTEVTDNKEITDEPIVEQSLEQPNDIKETSDDQTMTSATEQVFDLGPANMNISDLAPAQVKVEGDAPGLADIKFDNAASGRMSTAAKAALVRSMGGNSASEAAVAHGMRWLAKHQFPDGGWSFKHEAHAECVGQCSQSGTLEGGCRTGATGMALLAFLGGGHTHQSGDYQKEVKGGIEFLLKNAKSTPQGLDLCPTVVANEKMYTQGLCTIALSELAALTKDNRVKAAATGAVAFIVAGQNPKSGGWRYVPYPASADPGDTSVVGWQIMALKSAKNAKLPVSGSAFKGAELYLNAAQTNGGSQYMYDLQQKAPTPTMTAAGLLCRMYLGWDRKNKSLQEGVKFLAAAKPAPNNMYYNYYATQVMHHWGGDEWTTWNGAMRDQLIRTQKTAKDGHMQGSWDLADPHGATGGRLYMSCLCIMTLEVYYRHLPIYRREGLKVEF
eukprot:TRINITY_DN761_c1_g1_i2.p1 TRINITY_DN761_c1_g1~~TRINITY_DN761_c1_g1_i2.p1  ORF type:complete len:657 (-),score=142.06 TRINITY_DN761_c1_g1_i2:2863-4833(-)